MTTRLDANQQLKTSDELIPDNNTTHLIMQDDGNLVLYRNDNNVALWSSGTWDKPVTHAVMQDDGNFVCYADNGVAYWSTGTWGSPGAYLVLEDDGDLVVYGANGGLLWHTNTQQTWDPMSFDTGEQTLGAGMWMHSWASMASNGLISGHTRIWSTMGLKGFHGSVLPMLMDAEMPAPKTIWPAVPDDQKHQYYADGYLVGPHDITSYWTNSVDPTSLANAKALTLVQYYDPKSQLLNDIAIIGKTVAEILAAIEKAIGLGG